MSGTNRIKITSNGKPERIRVFDETYISDNIKLQQDGLGSIVLFGHQVQIENRIKEIESNLLSIAEKIEQQKKTCSNYTDTGNMASPAYWLARITKTLQSVGGWAETDGIRIKKHQIKTRVTDTEVKRLGQLVTEKSEEDVTAQFEQLITVYRLVLHTESHSEEAVQGAPETSFYGHISRAEKQRTTRDILCFMYSVNKVHVLAHIPKAKNDILTWMASI